ncbi:MAG: hypothetical protein WEE64_12360 [Dehalococcoidia bacterium]
MPMVYEHSVVEAGALWAKMHPHGADRIRDVVTGVFAIKKCHEPEEMLCANCYRELVRVIREEDPSVAESMRKGEYTWTRAWLHGAVG